MTMAPWTSHKCLVLAWFFSAVLGAQAAMSFQVQVRAVDRNGDALSKVRIAMLPVPSGATPLPRCIYPYCERVSPGRYTLMVAAETMLTIRREIVVSQYDRVIFAEMTPLFLVEPAITGLRSVIVTVAEAEQATLTIRLLGVLNDTVRSASVTGGVVEFREVVTGRYILLLLRHGKAVACRTIWHDGGSISRETLLADESVCNLHL